jgi:hypothetical protein
VDVLSRLTSYRTILLENRVISILRSDIGIILSIAILANSLILFERSLVDELLVFVVLVYLFTSRKHKLSFNISRNWIEVVFFIYLITHILITYYVNSQVNLSNIRFLIIYFALLLFILKFGEIKQNLYMFTQILILIYSYFYLLYYIVMHFANRSWEEYQAIYWSGSVGAAYAPAIGCILATYRRNPNSSSKLIQTINFQIIILATLLGVLYSSRILYVIVTISLLYLFLTKNFLLIISILFPLIFISPFILYDHKNERQSLDLNLTSLKMVMSDEFQVLRNSFNIIQPGGGDDDRRSQLLCIRSMVLNSSSSEILLWGYGHNEHKIALLDCPDISEKLSPVVELVRPVGLTAFGIDFGLTGLLLFFIVFFRKLYHFSIKSFNVNALIILFISFGFLLISNSLDIMFLNIILFTSYLGSLFTEKN